MCSGNPLPDWAAGELSRGVGRYFQSGNTSSSEYSSGKKTWIQKIRIPIIIFTNSKLIRQANGANEDGTTFPGLGKIDYVLTEASVNVIVIIAIIINMVNGQWSS